MSDREFENYLTLLAGLLRLDGKQRQAIAEELRSHLEDRLEELVARGVSREDAVQQALAEFGDAAGLAGQFAAISQTRRRRWLMRVMTFSVAATLLLAAGIAIFWPGRNAAPGIAEAVAQDARSSSKAGEASKDTPGSDTKLAEALNRRINIEFDNVPLKDVAAHLTRETGVTFHVMHKKLEEASLSLDTPITSNFRNIRLSTWLELALKELELAYVEKDDLIVITTPEDAESELQIRVYDCRDLLAMGPPDVKQVPRAPVPPSAMRSEMSPPPSSKEQLPQLGGGGTSVNGPFKQQEPVSELDRRAEDLIDLVIGTVKPDSWDDVGGPGGIDAYNGLVVVAQTDEVHKKVERLFDMLREAAGLEVKAGKVVR
jgi:hypothetical protein